MPRSGSATSQHYPAWQLNLFVVQFFEVMTNTDVINECLKQKHFEWTEY